MKLICPCCGKPAQLRDAPLTEYECERAYMVMKGKGVTAAAMLGEHRNTLDKIAPGLTGWVHHQAKHHDSDRGPQDPFNAFRNLAVT